MKNKIVKVLAGAALSVALMAGCGNNGAAETTTETKQTTEVTEKTADKEEADTQAASGEITFSDLQDNYKLLVECYDEVEALYANENIAQDSEVESLLTEAKSIIDEMGELKEEDFNGSDDMISINDSMATMVEALGGIVDKMQAADNGEAAEESDVTFVDGFYATDGDAEYVLAFYESDGVDVAYVTDGVNEVFSGYTVESAATDDGDEYLLVTVGNLALGYIEDGEDIYLVDEDGNIFGAARLTEEEAAEIVASVQ